jgi:hypothetical protein
MERLSGALSLIRFVSEMNFESTGAMSRVIPYSCIHPRVGACCFGNCLCSIHDRRDQFTFTKCRRTEKRRSAACSDRRQAQARFAKGRNLRGQGPARRLLDPGQNQRRQPHIDDHRPERHECIGDVKLERRYDGPSSSGQQPGLRVREACAALTDRAERAAIPLSLR